MKKFLVTICLLSLLTACGNDIPATSTQQTEATPSAEPQSTQAIPRAEIYPDVESHSEGLTAVSTVDCRLISADSFETVTLYTSAKKENGRFVWDDHAKWVLEVTSDTGSIYTLYENEVSNGSIYFDIIEVDSKKYILVKNISTAANYTKTFVFEDGKLYDTDELDLNNMSDKAINLIYTSIPNYR